MKRISLIATLLLLSSIFVNGKDSSMPKITYGVEWGYIAVFYSGYHHNFFAPEGYRVDPRGHEFVYDSNAEACMNIGYNFNEKYNLALYMGLSAIEDYHHTVPVSLRLTRYHGGNHLSDRWFSFVDLGSGISIKSHPQEILTGKIGGGYRISLSRSAKLDFLVALRSVLTHPDIEYYGTEIDYSSINRNNAYISAISLSMALTF